MTRSEYQELVEFLGVQFGTIDRRFDAMEERLTRVEVLAEDDRHQIRIVAEGVGAVWSELGNVRSEMAEGFAAVRSEMAEGFGAVWSEFGNVRSEMAEGFVAVRSEMAEGFVAVRSEMAAGFDAVRSEMAAGFDAQGRLIRGLGGRVGRLEA